MSDEREQDALGTLIRRSGRRAAVSEDRKARVKQAVRAHWRRELQVAAPPGPRRLPYWLAAAAALVVLVGIGAWLAGAFDGAGATPWIRVEIVADGVRLADGTGVAPGATLPVGSEISTGRTGRIALRAASGHSVRLHGDSTLRVFGDAVLELVAGTVYVDSGRPARSETDIHLEVRTPLGVVREIGTQFEVALAPDSLRLRVREGSIAVESGGKSYELQAGYEMRLDPDGQAGRRPLAPHASEWSWLEATRPALEIEGRTLREFLNWAVREGGWTLELATPPGGETADEIRLNGSIRGLTLDEALDAVLPTCGLRHRIEAGALIVEPPAE